MSLTDPTNPGNPPDQSLRSSPLRTSRQSVLRVASPSTLSPEQRIDLEQRYLRSLTEKYEYWRSHFTALPLATQQVLSSTGINLPVDFLPSGFTALEMHDLASEIEIRQVHLESLEAALHKYDKLALLGEPGSGKTTSLWKLALDYADRGLTEPSKKPVLPILVSLSECVTDDIVAFVDSCFGLLSGYLTEYLPEGRLLILFDGLNEVPRKDFVARVDQLRDFIAHNARNRYIVTCRKLDYDERLGLQVVELEELNDEHIQIFLTNYAGGVRGQDIFRLLNDDRENLLMLSRNPYNLLMMAYIYGASQGRLPSNRSRLLAAFIDTLITRERSRSTDPWVEPSLLKQSLSFLAFAMQEGWGPGKAVSRDWCLQQLASVDPLGSPENIIHLAAGAYLIGIPDEELLRFRHPLLQEYFSALRMEQKYRQGDNLTKYWQIHWLEHEMPPYKRSLINEYEPFPSPPTNGWESATLLLASMNGVDTAALVKAINDTNPLLAGRCLLEPGVAIDETSKNVVTAKILLTMSDPQVALRNRLAVGEILGYLGDPRFHGAYLEPDLVEIPAGEFLLGDEIEEVRRIHGKMVASGVYVTSIPGFSIAKYPTTNAQYAKFIEAKGYDTPEYWTEDGWRWRQGEIQSQTEAFFQRRNHDIPAFWDDGPLNKPNYPVVGITWYEAIAYCNWLSKATGKKYVLPSEAEWEKAARGPDSRREWPWGNDFNPAYANTWEGTAVANTTPVGIYPQNMSPYGVMDLIGNVWEWTRSLFVPYPYIAGDGREDLEAGGNRIVRGGAFFSLQTFAHISMRLDSVPNYVNDHQGFRLAQHRS